MSGAGRYRAAPSCLRAAKRTDDYGSQSEPGRPRRSAARERTGRQAGRPPVLDSGHRSPGVQARTRGRRCEAKERAAQDAVPRRARCRTSLRSRFVRPWRARDRRRSSMGSRATLRPVAALAPTTPPARYPSIDYCALDACVGLGLDDCPCMLKMQGGARAGRGMGGVRTAALAATRSRVHELHTYCTAAPGSAVTPARNAPSAFAPAARRPIDNGPCR